MLHAGDGLRAFGLSRSIQSYFRLSKNKRFEFKSGDRRRSQRAL
jgi:hypothetical protein